MELETNVAVPATAEVKPKAAAKRARASKKTPPSAAASLINALKFAKVAQSKAGTIGQQHCMISGGWLAASNGTLTVGCKIEEDLSACPHSTNLLEALLKCGQELNITQLTANTLSVKSGVFKALIPCVSFAELEISAPDAQIAAIDDRLKAAIECVLPLATDGAPNAVFASVLLQAGTAVATNGAALLECWHGIDLPPGMMLPKASAAAIAKAGKPLTGFGYSGASATFYYEDGSFIKTQLFNERYPHYAPLLDVEANPWPLPDGFFIAVHSIENFSRNGVVYFDESMVSSHEHETEASTYQIEGLPHGMAFNSKYLTLLEHAFIKADFNKEANKVWFFGENSRGVLMAVDSTKDDIPF